MQNNSVEGPIDLVARAGGYRTAYVFTSRAEVTENTLLIQFLRTKETDAGFIDNAPLANAIRVVQLEAATPQVRKLRPFLRLVGAPFGSTIMSYCV